jgi:hypothetical protein
LSSWKVATGRVNGAPLLGEMFAPCDVSGAVKTNADPRAFIEEEFRPVTLTVIVSGVLGRVGDR